jgi:protein TonB
MFERSLVESQGVAITQTQRSTALGSLTVQCAVAGLLIAIPLLRPQVLPLIADGPRLTAPFLSKPPAQPVQVKTSTTASTTAMSAPAASAAAAAGSRGISLLPHPGVLPDGAPTLVTDLHMNPGGTGFPGVFGDGAVGTAANVTVMRTRPIGPVRVSQGVSQGMLLTPIQPPYPPIAKVAGIQGAVVMEAVISKAGRIESLRVVSGPPMLQRAALEAVQSARYAPYKLSGEPVDVQTTITVVFQLRS